MMEGETLVAERDVVVAGRHTLNVRISQHDVEAFWRVQVTSRTGARSTSATTATGSSFLMNLIEEAVRGEPAAWSHLAQWGHTRLPGPDGVVTA